MRNQTRHTNSNIKLHLGSLKYELSKEEYVDNWEIDNSDGANTAIADIATTPYKYIKVIVILLVALFLPLSGGLETLQAVSAVMEILRLLR